MSAMRGGDPLSHGVFELNRLLVSSLEAEGLALPDLVVDNALSLLRRETMLRVRCASRGIDIVERAPVDMVHGPEAVIDAIRRMVARLFDALVDEGQCFEVWAVVDAARDGGTADEGEGS